jgi:hypothetical protein
MEHATPGTLFDGFASYCVRYGSSPSGGACGPPRVSSPRAEAVAGDATRGRGGRDR